MLGKPCADRLSVVDLAIFDHAQSCRERHRLNGDDSVRVRHVRGRSRGSQVVARQMNWHSLQMPFIACKRDQCSHRDAAKPGPSDYSTQLSGTLYRSHVGPQTFLVPPMRSISSRTLVWGGRRLGVERRLSEGDACTVCVSGHSEADPDDFAR